MAPEVKRGPWTPEEDKRLSELINAHGGGNWSVITEHMEGRTDADCAKRWLKINPVAASKASVARAARLIHIPKKRRKTKTSLEGNDFSLAVTENLQSILSRLASAVVEPTKEQKSSFRSNFRAKMAVPNTGFHLTDVDRRGLRRLALLK